MTVPSPAKPPGFRTFLQSLGMIYLLGFAGSFLYFNWSYAQRHGFTKWLLLGEIVPTAQAVIWPHYALQWSTNDSKWTGAESAAYVTECTSAYAGTMPNARSACTCLVNEFSRVVTFAEYDRSMRHAAVTNTTVADPRLTSAMAKCVPR